MAEQMCMPLVNSVRKGRVDTISGMTARSSAGSTSFTTQLARDEIRKLVASIDSIVKVLCWNDIFPEFKFAHDGMTEMLLETGCDKKKIAIGDVMFQKQLIQVGPKLVHT